MSGEGESRLKRWSRRKGQDREGAPEPEAEKPDSVPVAAKRRVAPVMLPLAAEPEEGEIAMERPSPEALELLRRHRAGELETQETPEEEAELTPEQEEAVRDLPPIESLNKDSDFTPFLAQNVPDFLKRQAYRVLWRSDPFFNFRDGLDDYDEDLRLFKLIGEAVSGTKGIKKASKKASKTASKTGKDPAADDEAAPPEEEWADEDEIDDVGEGDDDGDDLEEMAESDSEEDDNEGEEQA